MIPIMLDSGAYSAFRKGKTIDIYEYIDYVWEMKVKVPESWLTCVSLDVIGDGHASYANWCIMRCAGLEPLPVYHVGTDVKFLQFYLRDCDYIGLGAIANLSSTRRMLALDRIWDDYLLDAKRMPKVKVHGMGIAGFKLMGRYPWFSIDTTSWLLVAGYGGIFFPRRASEGGWDYKAAPLKLFVSNESPAGSDLGKHFDTVSSKEQALIRDYVESIGEAMEDVKKDWEARARVNVYVYAKYVEALGPWPRAAQYRAPISLFKAKVI